MSALTQSILSAESGVLGINARDVSRFSPEEIRHSVAELVAQGNMMLADALTEAGISLYPESEEIIAIASLLAEVKQDWAMAANLLKHLIRIQGDLAPPTTWLHLIRVLRCQCEVLQALQAVDQALIHHPDDKSLMAEKVNLIGLIPSVSSVHDARDAA